MKTGALTFRGVGCWGRSAPEKFPLDFSPVRVREGSSHAKPDRLFGSDCYLDLGPSAGSGSAAYTLLAMDNGPVRIPSLCLVIGLAVFFTGIVSTGPDWVRLLAITCGLMLAVRGGMSLHTSREQR